jgi:hypothetical protein
MHNNAGPAVIHSAFVVQEEPGGLIAKQNKFKSLNAKDAKDAK